jgi:AraC family transcriptional regulator
MRPARSGSSPEPENRRSHVRRADLGSERLLAAPAIQLARQRLDLAVLELRSSDAVVEDVSLQAVNDQLILMVTAGTTTIESRHGPRWRKAEYYPGRIAMTAAGQSTRLRWHGPGSIQTAHVHLRRSLLDRTAQEPWGQDADRLGRPDDLVADDPVLASVIQGLERAALAGADDLYAEAAATFLAAHLLVNQVAAPLPRSPSREEVRIRHAVAFIRENYHRPISLAEMAAVADLSTFHFLRVFKAATGQTPHRYLIGVRLGHARRLLEREDVPVTQIAYRCGFASPSRLATAFRHRTGMSPSSYRARCRAGPAGPD